MFVDVILIIVKIMYNKFGMRFVIMFLIILGMMERSIIICFRFVCVFFFICLVNS